MFVAMLLVCLSTEFILDAFIVNAPIKKIGQSFTLEVISPNMDQPVNPTILSRNLIINNLKLSAIIFGAILNVPGKSNAGPGAVRIST